MTGISCGDRVERYYYAGWRVVEETDNAGTPRTLAQTVWGTEYIDEPVCRDRNTDVAINSDCLDSGGSVRYFYHQDANFRVCSLTSESGAIVERYEYDAYGEPRVFGGVASSGAEGFAPLHFSAAGNPYLHQGLRRDDESGLHENRYRSVHSRLGRFGSRDHLEYWDGSNSYEYLTSEPTSYLDPSGRGLLSWLNGYGWDGEEAEEFDDEFARSAWDRTKGTIRSVTNVVPGVDLGAAEEVLGGGDDEVGDVTFDEERAADAELTADMIQLLASLGINGAAAAKCSNKFLRAFLLGLACFTADTSVLTTHGPVPIDSVSLGSYVVIEQSDDERFGVIESTIAGDDLFHVELSLADVTGSIEIGLLRDQEWIASSGVEAGETTWIALPELGLQGEAFVSAVDPIAIEDSANGALVTGTFSRHSAILLEISFVECVEPLLVTPRHPLFSDDRETWVDAEQVRVGERLRTNDGTVTVKSTATRRGLFRVFNLEVDGQHRYYAGDCEVLSHNVYTCNGNSRLARRAQLLYALLQGGKLMKIGVTGNKATTAAGVPVRVATQITKKTSEGFKGVSWTPLGWFPNRAKVLDAEKAASKAARDAGCDLDWQKFP
ncbi:MAG: RHS repeat-associated core domain-containing protein [Planctomycetota bacterium]